MVINHIFFFVLKIMYDKIEEKVKKRGIHNE